MKFSRIALVLAAIADFLLLVGGPGTRFGLWEFSVGFLMMRWAAYLGLAAAGLALPFLIIPRSMRAGMRGVRTPQFTKSVARECLNLWNVEL